MQLAFESKCLGNLPETTMSKFGILKRDNTLSGVGKRRFLLFVDKGKESHAFVAANNLHLQNSIILEELTQYSKMFVKEWQTLCD